MGKHFGKNIYRQKHLDHAKQPATDALKTSSKRVLQKTLVIKLLIELQKFQKIHNKINQRQLQICMIMKYLKKNMYLQKKDKKLSMN